MNQLSPQKKAFPLVGKVARRLSEYVTIMLDFCKKVNVRQSKTNVSA